MLIRLTTLFLMLAFCVPGPGARAAGLRRRVRSRNRQRSAATRRWREGRVCPHLDGSGSRTGPRSGLWLVDSDGSNLQPLTPRSTSASSPRWSPDNQRLAFIADGQIHMLWMDSGRQVQVSTLDHSPSSLSWSPDGSWLAFVMHTPTEASNPVSLPGKPKGAEWAPEAIYIDSLFYRADGAGYVTPGFRQVYMMPAEGGSPIRLTEGDFDHGGISWHPDGSALYLTANRSGNAEREPLMSDIYRMEIESRELERITPRVRSLRSSAGFARRSPAGLAGLRRPQALIPDQSSCMSCLWTVAIFAF